MSNNQKEKNKMLNHLLNKYYEDLNLENAIKESVIHDKYIKYIYSVISCAIEHLKPEEQTYIIERYKYKNCNQDIYNNTYTSKRQLYKIRDNAFIFIFKCLEAKNIQIEDLDKTEKEERKKIC